MARANLSKIDPSKTERFDEIGAAFDICFVLNVNSRGWILEKICKIIEQSSGRVCYYLFSERNDRLSASLPRARHYVFAHFSLCYFTMLNQPEVLSGNCYVWYTHLDAGKGVSQSDLIDMTRLCTHVFTPCSHNRDELISWGADADKISVPLGGADPAQFQSTARTGKGAIGFVGAYYERKQPERMLQIAKLMPNQPIILLGPRAEDVENPGILWRNWDRLAEFQALPNVQYIEADYTDFAQWYREFDVYCSTSRLEGGPIPAIEAMMSNVMPVISDTGFARDIIDHGRTGYVFDIKESAQNIVTMIRAALADTRTDVAAAAADYSWDAFGAEIWGQMRGTAVLGDRIDMSRNENAVRYLLRGFHVPEARGVWTRSHQAEVALPLSTNQKPSQMSFYAWAPVELGDETIAATLTVNGHAADPVRLGPKPQVCTIPLTEEMLRNRDTLYVTIETDRMFSPKDRDEASRETRLLGVKVGWLQLK